VRRAGAGLLAGLLFLALLVPVGAEGPTPPSEFYVAGIVGHAQERPLSCEARSAVDLAAFWGVAVEEDALLDMLPRSDDPHRGFMGNVDDPPGSLPPGGYGVYAEPIARALRRQGLDACAHRWLGLERLKTELAAGRPVVVWATYQMLRPEVTLWTSSAGSVSIIVQWEHTFIAAGYDAGSVTLIDAYDGETYTYPTNQFVPAWMQLNEMAVTVAGPLEETPYPWRELKGEGSGPWSLAGLSLTGPR